MRYSTRSTFHHCCLLIPHFFLLFPLLIPSNLHLISAGAIHDPTHPEKLALEREISNLQTFIHRYQHSERNLGPQYAQLGLLYQSSDVRWHNGGKYKPIALENFNKALAYELSESDKILVLQRKGMLLKMMSKGPEAVDSHQEVLRIPNISKYDASEAYLHMADAQSMMGEVSQAIESLEKALKLNPNNLEAYYPLVQACKELNCKTAREWAQLVQEMEVAAERASNPKKGIRTRRQRKISLSDEEDDDDEEESKGLSTGIYWALYEAGLKAENITLAWSYLDLAHKTELKNRGSKSQTLDESQRTSLILQIFKRGFWPSGVGSTSKLPVFIVGMMRSGSTLLETILDAHPNVFGLGEDSIFNSQLPEVKEHVVKAASGSNDEVIETVAKDAKSITSKMIALAKEMDSDSSKGKILRVVDKMLFNYRNIGFIHLLYPQSTILHTVRDPMDTLLSCFTQKFDDKGLEWSFQPATLVEMYVDYLTIMNHFRNELPGRVLDINYEEVVRQPDRVIKNLIVNKLGLPWDERVLNFHTTNRSVHTHSMHQVRQGLYLTSIGKWVKFRKQLEPIRKLLLPKLKEMHARGQLPFPGEINWLLDPTYNYHGENNRKLPDSKANETGDPGLPEAVPSASTPKERSIKHSSQTPSKRKSPIDTVSSASIDDDQSTKDSKKNSSQGKRRKKRAKKSGKVSPKKKAKISRQQRQKPTSAKSRRQRRTQKSSKTDVLFAFSKPSNMKREVLVTREQIKTLFDEKISSFPPDVVKHLGVIKSSLPYPTGDTFLDDLGAVSVALYNLGKLKDCIQFSQKVLQYNQSLHSISVALASALAMEGKLEESLLSMNSLISDRTKRGLDIGADAFERRAQVLMALGDTNTSIADLTKAIKIAPSINSYTARAAAFVREQRYWESKKDAMAAIKMGANTAQLWNIVGRCEREFGEPEKAIAAQTKALQLESTYKEALLEMAVTYMAISNARKALEYLDKCLALDPLLKNAHGYKGLLLQNMGRAKDTITAFQEAYKIDPTDTQALQFTAFSYQAMGDYKSAIEWFEKTLSADPDHYVWSLREMAYYRWRMLDTPFTDYNPDTDIHWLLKDAWIRRAPLRNYCGPGIEPWCHYKLTLHHPKELKELSKGSIGVPMSKYYNRTRKNQLKEVVSLTSPISRWIQVDSPGFLKHERQHKMFGAMVLQMAQLLISHYRQVGIAGGLVVPHAARSRRVLLGKDEEIEEGESATPEVEPIFGWRDFFDIAVKWRQIAEPFDTVFWIDCTAAQEDQADKVGLQTFLYHGVGKNIRYYPYFNKTFTLLKQLTPNGYYVGVENFSFKLPPKSSLPGIEQARSLKEFLDAAQPLYVLTPLKSRRTPEAGPLEGTRIAISPVTPKGENLYISTGTSYERYDRYYQELELALDRVVEWAIQTKAPFYSDMDPQTSQDARDEGLTRCLEFYYYWINFSPLSRGTAAVGYASIVACMISFGDIPTNPLPKGVQLDWEAILTLSPEDFIATARPFLQQRTPVTTFLPSCWLEQTNQSCQVSEIIKTARDAIYLMNGMYDDDEEMR